MADELLREVDESLRQERAKRLAKAAAPYVIIAFIVLALAVAGRQWWLDRQADQARADAQAYNAAMELSGEPQEAALRELVETAHGGYGPLAALKLAGDALAAGDEDRAVAHYRQVVADDRSGPEMARFAAVQAVSLRLDEMTPQQVEVELSDLTGRATPFGAKARELVAMAYFQNGFTIEARERLEDVRADPQAGPAQQQRAGALLDLLPEEVDEPVQASGEAATPGSDTAAEEGVEPEITPFVAEPPADGAPLADEAGEAGEADEADEAGEDDTAGEAETKTEPENDTTDSPSSEDS